jgi:hypothetical protein
MSVTGRSQQAGQLTVGRVGAIGVWDAQGRPVRHPLRYLFLSRLPGAARRLSLARREALHEDQDPATRRQRA